MYHYREAPYLYRARNRVERVFNRIKQYLRVATRYDKLAAIILLLSSLRQSGCGCGLMSLRHSLFERDLTSLE